MEPIIPLVPLIVVMTDYLPIVLFWCTLLCFDFGIFLFFVKIALIPTIIFWCTVLFLYFSPYRINWCYYD